MKWKLLILVAAAASSFFTAPAFAQGTGFTYQGRLTDNGNPANGNYDLQFYLRDTLAGGSPVGATNTRAPLSVSNGVFTVTLDFGAGIFTGPGRWMEIGARTNGSVAAYTTLAPRQALTPTPYAITASNLTGTLPAAQLSGTLPASSLAGTYSGAVTFNNAANSFAGNGAGLTNLNLVGNGIGISNILTGDLWHLNRFGWGNTLKRLGANGPVQIMGFGEGAHFNGIYYDLMAYLRSIAPDNGYVAPGVSGGTLWAYANGATTILHSTNKTWYVDFGRLHTATSSSITMAGPFGSGILADVVEVDYLQTPGAGTFKLQVSVNGGAFTDQSTNNADGTKLGVAVRWTNNVAAYLKARVVLVSGGDVDIYAIPIVNYGTYDGTSWGFVQNSHTASGGQHWAGFFSGGQLDITNVVAPIWQSWQPQMLIYYELVQETNWPFYAPQFNGWLRTVAHLTNTDVVIINNQPDAGIGGGACSANSPVNIPGFNDNLYRSNIELRTNCMAFGWAYFDLYNTLGGVTNALNNGLISPCFDFAMTESGMRVAAQALFNWLGLGDSGSSASVVHKGQTVFPLGNVRLTDVNNGSSGGGLYANGPVWSYNSPNAELSFGGRDNNFAERFSWQAGGVYANLIWANYNAVIAGYTNNAGVGHWFFSGNGGTVATDGTFTGNGAGLTVLNASQLANGTVADVRLSSNVPLLNGSPTFAGTVTAASFSGAGALHWQVVSGTSVQASPGTGYLLTNNALVTVTLPASPNPGDVVRVSGIGAGGWNIAQNSGQSVIALNFLGGNPIGTAWTPHRISTNRQSVASSSARSKPVAVVNGGRIYTSVPTTGSSTTSGMAGYLQGSQHAALELQYIGDGQFIPLSHEGSILWY